MNAPGQTVLELKDLHISFYEGADEFPVLRGLSYRLEKGKVLAVVGESGCGKTIHALSILRLLPPNAKIVSGQICYKGDNLATLPLSKLRDVRGHKISMIFQDPMTSLNPVLTVGEQISETILAHRNVSRAEAKTRALELLKKVGIEDAAARYNEYPFQFSGGMRQRVMIAIALCLDPEILIADEPTTALDVTIQAQILKLIKTLQLQSGLSAVFITHNLAIVADIADEVLVLYAGECVERASVAELFAHPQHPYTQGLLGSLVTIRRKPEVLSAIEGNPPAPSHRRQGCAFAPRCPYVMAKCRVENPPLFGSETHETRCWLKEGK